MHFGGQVHDSVLNIRNVPELSFRNSLFISRSQAASLDPVPGWVVDCFSSPQSGWLTDFVVLQATSFLSLEQLMLLCSRKKKTIILFLEAAECPCFSFQPSISAITAQSSRNLLPAPNQAEVCSQLCYSRLVTHLADLEDMTSCPFNTFLVFERIFQSNNSPGWVNSGPLYIWGPYTLPAQNLQRFQFASELAVATEHAQFSSGRQSWAGGSWEMREVNTKVTTKNGAWIIRQSVKERKKWKLAS